MSTISKSCVDFANDYPRSDVEAMCCGGCHSSGYPKIDEEIGEWEYQGKDIRMPNGRTYFLCCTKEPYAVGIGGKIVVKNK